MAFLLKRALPVWTGLSSKATKDIPSSLVAAGEGEKRHPPMSRSAKHSHLETRQKGETRVNLNNVPLTAAGPVFPAGVFPSTRARLPRKPSQPC
jgi:hypothetical protein